MKQKAQGLQEHEVVQRQGDNKQYNFVVGTMVKGKFVAKEQQ